MIAFTDADIRAGANSQSYSRGYEYFSGGAVADLVRRDNLLTAEVAGSQYEPYAVSITLTADGQIAAADCSCPFEWSGYCKHIVAVLLAALDDEEEVVVRPGVEALLADLSEAQLRRLIRMLAEGEPKLLETIEKEVRWLKMQPAPGATAPAASAIPVDLAAIRREIRKDLRHAASSGGGHGDRYWDDDEGGEIYPDEILGPHKKLVAQLLAAGDAARAGDVVGAMIEEWGSGVEDLDEWVLEANEDPISMAQMELGVLLAEALLSQNLLPEQRQQWLARVEDWGNEYFDLEPAEMALEQWWDFPPLAEAMQGRAGEQGAWDDEAPEFADELTLARLRILERQGRIQEYIHLAAAEGQMSLYVQMLARSGQVEKAVSEARLYLTGPSELLALAQLLAAQGQPAAALAVAGHAVEIPSERSKQDLGRWTAALAQQQGDPALALRAAKAAFGSGWVLADFKLAKGLAGEGWPAVKAELLAAMAASHSANKAEVYLSEGMLVEAMAVIDHSAFANGLEQVIQATRAEHPDWGIRKCKRQAEAIMDAGKADAYGSAVGWLRTARDIYVLHGRQVEWSAYLSGLLEKHARKYKLVPMLKGLR